MSEFIESSNLMFLELDKHLETLISAFKGGPNLGSSSNSGKMTPETVGFVLLFHTKSEMWLVWGTLLVNLWVYSLSQFRQVKLCRIKSSVGEKYPGCLVVKEKGDKLRSGSVGKKAPTMPHCFWWALKARSELSQSDGRRSPFQKPKS